jgi:pimeloyl-ACP methyl ester carboxylesterase
MLHLKTFIKEIALKNNKNGKVIIGGASLGGALAMILAVECPELVDKVVLIDAQGFIDAWVSSFHSGTLGNVSDTMEASLINDKVLDYVAHDYEKVMIPRVLRMAAIGHFEKRRPRTRAIPPAQLVAFKNPPQPVQEDPIE